MNCNNKALKDIINVTVSNFISLTSSILNGFVMPVLLGTLNYGYYKIFVLYASYTVLFHFGFNDGIMLAYGGKHYSDLNKYNFRSNSSFFIWFQIVISVIIILLSFFTSNHFYKILFILLGVNDFTQNLLGYYQKISQAIMRFTEYSIVNTIQYILLIISVISILIYHKLYKLHNMSYIPYVSIIILINTILLLWYLYRYRFITFGPHPPFICRFNTFKTYFVSGFYMTFGYGISVLIFNLDSQFVIKFFSTRTYGIYAFAYSIFSAGLTILSAASIVILPHLKRHSVKYIMGKYSQNISYINILVFALMSGYSILDVIIYKFIYEYHMSLVYFKLLFPGMAITCCVSIVICNYYYALKKERFYFFLSLFVLLISFLMDALIYLLFKTPSSLALSSTISLFIWYIISNYFVIKWFNIKFIKNLIYIMLMTMIFWLCNSSSYLFINFIMYLVLYISISWIMFRKIIVNSFRNIINLF